MTPEQEALYALHWNVPRSELSIAAQLEYDRLRVGWERGEARPVAGELEAARLAWEAQHPPAAPDRRDPPRVTGPGHKARTRTSEQVRDTTFQTVRRGYDITQVDRLLRRIAAELDAGRPVEPLVSNATFRTQLVGYDVAAVNRFLTEMSTDPWRDLDAVPGRFTREPSSRWPLRAPRGHGAEECSKAWDEFDQQPGTYLRLEWVGIARRELRSADLQTVASISFKWSDVFLATNRSEIGGQLSRHGGCY
jgi:DivIVA domain-containing protein